MRIAKLDGIRGLAVISVVLVHHDLFTEFGWAGVDLFFVLSGYLITNILLRMKDSEVYWSRFYIKRAARLLPALVVLFIVNLSLSRHFSGVAVLGYIFFLGGVINTTHLYIEPFGILWSLAVEEHFYFVWPWFVRKLTFRQLAMLTLSLILLEPVLRGMATLHLTSDTIYMLTPFRVDGLAAGSLLALISESQEEKRLLKRWSGCLALTIILLFAIIHTLNPAFKRDDHALLFNWAGYSIIVAICFFTVAWTILTEKGLMIEMLSWKPLAYIGRISYGIYLFHVTVILMMHKLYHIPFTPGAAPLLRPLFPISFLITTALASACFHFIELPVLRLGNAYAESLHTPASDESIAT